LLAVRAQDLDLFRRKVQQDQDAKVNPVALLQLSPKPLKRFPGLLSWAIDRHLAPRPAFLVQGGFADGPDRFLNRLVAVLWDNGDWNGHDDTPGEVEDSRWQAKSIASTCLAQRFLAGSQSSWSPEVPRRASEDLARGLRPIATDVKSRST